MGFLDGDDLPDAKTDRLPLRATQNSTQHVNAADWNAHRSAFLELREAGAPLVNAVRAHGVTPDDETAADTNITNILAAVAAASDARGAAFLEPGDYYVGRSLAASLQMNDLRYVRLFAQRGTARIRQKQDVTGTGTETKNVKLSNDQDVWLDGLILDGGWENAITHVSVYGHLDVFSSGCTIEVEDTEGLAPFPSSGTFEYIGKDGIQTITYTGKTETTFTGCTGGSGTMRQGDAIVRSSIYRGSATVGAGSNNANLASITSLSIGSGIDELPASAVTGEILIATSLGNKFISYTSKTGSTLEGVSGGTGVVTTGAAITYMRGQLGQLPTSPNAFTIDLKNHNAFAGSEDGDAPVRRLRISNCDIVNSFGDGVWVGRSTTDVLIENSRILLSGRNGLTLSNGAARVKLVNCDIMYAHTTEIDSEPVEGFTRDVTMINCRIWRWPNPGAADSGNLNICMSIVGGAVVRPAEHNYAQNWKLFGCDFRGGVLIENAAYVTATNCAFDNDVLVDGATSIGAVAIGQSSSKVVLRDCSYKGRVAGDSSYNYGVISVAPYRLAGTLSGATHAALSPSDITIDGGFVKATEGAAGVYIEGCGSTASISGTTSSYTPPTSSPSNTSGALAFIGTPFSGKVDWFVGRKVIETSTGYQANVVANSSSTLYLAPVAENYSAGLAWFDRNGLPVSDPDFASAKTVTILPAQGEIAIRNLRIDCARTDDSAAGGNGILFDTSSTFDTGYDDMRIDLDNNRIHGATGAGIKVWLRGPAASGSQLRLVDNIISDDQATATTTYGIELVGADGWDGVEMHGNRTRNSIPLVTGDEDIPYYLSSPDHPPTYTGNASPEGVLTAPYQSQFIYPAGNVTYRKHTSDSFNTGWTMVRTVSRPDFRAAGTMTAGVQSSSLTPTLATAFKGDIEYMQVIHLASDGSVTLSSAQGFAEVAHKDDGVLRMTILARRCDGTAVAPTIDAGGGKFAIARIYSVKDIAAGDVTTSATVESTGTSTHTNGSLSFSVAEVTSTSPGALMLTFIATHTGASTSSSLASLSSDEPLLIEQTTHVDQGQSTLGDRYTMAVVSGRRVTAGGMGDLSGTIQATSGSAFVMAITLALKPRDDT